MISTISSASAAYSAEAIWKLRNTVADSSTQTSSTLQNDQVPEDVFVSSNASSTDPAVPTQLSGARPAGGPPPSGGAPKTNSDSGTSTVTGAYDPQDLNKDGSVTAQERMQYLLRGYSPIGQISEPATEFLYFA